MKKATATCEEGEKRGGVCGKMEKKGKRWYLYIVVVEGLSFEFYSMWD